MLKNLMGKNTSHLQFSNKFHSYLHKDIIKDLEAMAKDLSSKGMNLKVASGFRSYYHQLKIFNEKAMGLIPILDRQGCPLPFSMLDNKEKLMGILSWSAIPGFGRHHWGTDLDVYESSALPKDYRVQLVPDEVDDDGILGPFHKELDQILEKYNFFRPYEKDTGGIAPERWHLSHRSSANAFEKLLNLEVFEEEIKKSPVHLKEEILMQAEEIFTKFILNR